MRLLRSRQRPSDRTACHPPAGRRPAHPTGPERPEQVAGPPEHNSRKPAQHHHAHSGRHGGERLPGPKLEHLQRRPEPRQPAEAAGAQSRVHVSELRGRGASHGQEKAAHMPHTRLQQGVREDVTLEGSSPVAHGGETFRV